MLGAVVASALREAKAERDYPPTVRGLFDRIVSAHDCGPAVTEVFPDPESLLRALKRAPLKNAGTVFAVDLDAPVALADDQPLLFSSERLVRYLARRVHAVRDQKKRPQKTVSGFVKDAKLSGKALKPAVEHVTAYLDGLLAEQLRDGTRLPDWLASVIDPDPTAIAAHLARTIEDASSARSTQPYPVAESVLRAIPGAGVVLDAKSGKSEFFSNVAVIRPPGSNASEPSYLLPRDLPKIALIHLHDTLVALGRRFTDTGLFSAEEVSRHLIDPAAAGDRSAKKSARSASGSATNRHAAPEEIIARAIEDAATKQALSPDIAWLHDKGTRRYFLRSTIETRPEPLATRHPAAPIVSPPPTINAAGFQAAFDRAFQELTAASGGRQIVLLSALRQKLPSVSREQFDTGLLQLWGVSYSLEAANDRHALSHADLAAAIVEGGTEYVYVVRRS